MQDEVAPRSGRLRMCDGIPRARVLGDAREESRLGRLQVRALWWKYTFDACSTP